MNKIVAKIPLYRFQKSVYITLGLVSALFTMVFTYKFLEGDFSLWLIVSALALTFFTLLFFRIRRFHFTLYPSEFQWQLPGMKTPNRVEIPQGRLVVKQKGDHIVLMAGKNTLSFSLSPLKDSDLKMIVKALKSVYTKDN